jgi:hypothetical protein
MRAKVVVALSVELRIVLKAGPPKRRLADHEGERRVQVVLATAGSQLSVVQCKTEAGLAVL